LSRRPHLRLALVIPLLPIGYSPEDKLLTTCHRPPTARRPRREPSAGRGPEEISLAVRLAPLMRIPEKLSSAREKIAPRAHNVLAGCDAGSTVSTPPCTQGLFVIETTRKDERSEDDEQSEIDQLKEELRQKNDLYLRALADFDNYRKRVQRDQAEASRAG